MRKALLVGLLPAVTLAAMAVSAQQAAAPAASGLTISRMEIASDVQNREPVGAAASFPAAQERVYCFLEFTDVAQEASVSVVWTLGMNEMARVPLTIKAYSKYRTWAYKTIAGMKGDWKVEIVDGAGNVLKSAAFKIE